jgi:hypothetical protein
MLFGNKCIHGATSECPDCAYERSGIAVESGDYYSHQFQPTAVKTNGDLLLLGAVGNHHKKEEVRCAECGLVQGGESARGGKRHIVGCSLDFIFPAKEPEYVITETGKAALERSKLKTGMCVWHTCQRPRLNDSRLCASHKTLQDKLDSTPLPKGKNG